MSIVTARVRLIGIVGLALVVAAAAAAPLHHELKPSQGAAVLGYVIPASLIPALLVRYALARRWLAFMALVGLAFAGVGALGLAGGLLPAKHFTVPKHNLTPLGGNKGDAKFAKATAAHAHQHTHVSLSAGLVVALFVLIALVVVVAIVVAMRRQPPPAPRAPVRKLAPPAPEEVARRFYSLVKDSLDDLRAEPDPRRAVIAAYARMELGLGTLGTERIPSETPFEYLTRVLERVSVSDEAARRLTDLFERAKFSPAPVDEAMKDDAVAALEAIKEEARAWAA
jgi:hypothetical protein